MTEEKPKLPNLQVLNLKNLDLPKITENINKGIVYFGADNLYPLELIKALNTSAIHNAIVTQKAKAVAGKAISYNADLKPKLIEKIKNFIKNPNDSDEDLYDILHKVALDYEVFGAFVLEIIWSKDGTKITEINHIDCSENRVEPMTDGKITHYLWSRDWSNTRKKDNAPIVVPAFSIKNAKRDGRQFIYIGDYRPGNKYYGTPSYIAAMDYIAVDGEMGNYLYNSMLNGMSPSLHCAFVDGVPSEEEQTMLSSKIKRAYTGSNNAGKIIVTFSETPEVKPQYTPIESGDGLDKRLVVTNDMVIQNILSGHRLTSPMLMGVKTSGQLGGASELSLSWEIFNKSVIVPNREKILKTFNKLIKLVVNDDTAELSIDSDPLIAVQFTEKIIGAIMTTDELRGQLGLGPMVNTDDTINGPGETQTPDETIDKVV